jgi:hypothetical protein
MDATRRPVTEVERAIQAHTQAIARLIRLLKHRAAAVRSGAADAVRGLDTPPVWDLIGVLIKTRDTRFRVEIGSGTGGRIPRSDVAHLDAVVLNGSDRIRSHGAPPRRMTPDGFLGSPPIVSLRS